MNHGKFKGKGEEILASQKPNSLGEFSAETPDAGMTETRKPVRRKQRKNRIRGRKAEAAEEPCAKSFAVPLNSRSG
jgi:hypothetical protein